MLHMRPYSHMLNCDKWAAISELVFPSTRTDSRAVQAVRVHKASQPQSFTFCLQRVDVGPYKVRACEPAGMTHDVLVLFCMHGDNGSIHRAVGSLWACEWETTQSELRPLLC